jgi:protein TonB
MRSALLSFWSNRHDPQLRRRAIAFLLMIAVHLLLLFFALQSGSFTPRKPPGALTTINVNSYSEKPVNKKEAKQAEASANVKAPAKATPIPPPIVPPIAMPDILILSSKDFAASDISKMPRASDKGVGDNGVGQAAAMARGNGEAPGGAQLYNAEWVFEPTDAEMAYYMPRNLPAGAWGEIMCRTIPGNKVTDCREMDSNPPGTRLAGALRQASWQFRVRPPRIGGKLMVGEWVRIHFDIRARKDQ